MKAIQKRINFTLAFLWIYQGLIPKFIFLNEDEITIWKWLGLSRDLAEIAGRASGLAEIIFGILFISLSRKFLHYVNILSLIFLFSLAVVVLPNILTEAFNPMVMNVAMIALSLVWLDLNKKTIS